MGKMSDLYKRKLRQAVSDTWDDLFNGARLQIRVVSRYDRQLALEITVRTPGGLELYRQDDVPVALREGETITLDGLVIRPPMVDLGFDE
jgi:hypothetical protein